VRKSSAAVYAMLLAEKLKSATDHLSWEPAAVARPDAPHFLVCSRDKALKTGFLLELYFPRNFFSAGQYGRRHLVRRRGLATLEVLGRTRPTMCLSPVHAMGTRGVRSAVVENDEERS